MASTLLTTSAAPLSTQGQVQGQVQPAPFATFTPAAPAPAAPAAPASKWTPENFTDASQRHDFISISLPNRPRLTIQDAYEVWETNPNILFHTGYRIAGTREDIAADLAAAGQSEADIEGIINSAISSENYLTDMAAEFHDEMKKYIIWNRTAVKTNVAAPGATLFGTMSALNPALLAQATAKSRPPGTGGPGRKVEPIMQKLQKLAPGNYLDVSNMDDFGRGTKPIPANKLAGRTGTNRIPIVSNKADRYIAAINMIPGGAQTYADDIAQVVQILGTPAAPAPTGYYQPPAPAPLAQQPPTFMAAGAPGFQPFAPMQPAGVLQTPVGAIMTPKQRKQKAAAAQSFPGFAPQPPAYATAVSGAIMQGGRPLDMSNVMDEDEGEYYDEEEEEGEYYDNTAVQPAQQFAPSFQPSPAPAQQFAQPPRAPLAAPQAAFPAQRFAPAPLAPAPLAPAPLAPRPVALAPAPLAPRPVALAPAPLAAVGLQRTPPQVPLAPVSAPAAPLAPARSPVVQLQRLQAPPM